MEESRVFSIEEANQLLPRLTKLIKHLHELRNEVSNYEVKIDALELIAEVASGRQQVELQELARGHQAAVKGFYATVEEIQSHGCFLKDVDIGLIDFYGKVGSETVFLCWRLGEDQVQFWHEIGKGYAFRRILPEAGL
jgi:hypothetical protein